ncbi:hypothetical protein K503DRAFT_842089 [Rhizopogon vinicolor AM-OR11-026]|uniref:Uncharacterized protein n=1 Tax=Rhizopogon vinicolor AM-OR11-026 TaxID=1314800 RepID=A0A1B7MJH6_9AGAM|nr:hypothetical protein K503DRAFT_842089 [Rhizopogon vinicolor AM-OR11-026]
MMSMLFIDTGVVSSDQWHAVHLPSALLTDAGLLVQLVTIVLAVRLKYRVILGLSLTAFPGTILYLVVNCIGVIANIMLSVIMITRLYPMYQGSKQMLIFLVSLLAIQITSKVVTMILTIKHVTGEELVLSGAHMCNYSVPENGMFAIEVSYISATAWETLVLCLAVWIALHTTFVVTSSLQLGDDLTPKIANSTSAAAGIFIGILGLIRVVQIFILGPRLILGVREYHANHVSNSDEGPDMSIAFQERVHISTGDEYLAWNHSR